MSNRSVWSLLVLALTFVIASAADTCGNGKKCPEDSPCCSQYGECGTGLYCLGACDAANSYNLSACAPMPVCKAGEQKFSNLDRIADQAKYLGDADKYDWVTNGKVVTYQNNLLLTMAKDSYGTVLTSTRYVWYGKVSATLKTSHGAGVVSAFIFMSGSKDEIDYEFVGNDVGNAQNNFYYEGVLNYTNGAKAALSSTNETYHNYEIDWTPDKITWSIDGQTARVLNRADTYNATSKVYMFPSTPSVIQLSLWPGGSSKNAKGTVDWAGGPINWDMPEFTNPGYLYVTVKDISVDCYDAPSDAGSGNVYTWKDGITADDVEIKNTTYVMGSEEAVGWDMDKGKDSDTHVSQVLPTDIGGTHPTSSVSNDKKSNTSSATSISSGKSSSAAASSSSAAKSSDAAASASKGAGSSTQSVDGGFDQGGSSASATGAKSDASTTTNSLHALMIGVGAFVGFTFLGFGF